MINFLKSHAGRAIIMCIIGTIFIIYIALSNHKKRVRFYGYWKDGSKYGKELSKCEINAVKNSKNRIRLFLEKENSNDSVILNAVISEAKESFESRGYIDYGKLSSLGESERSLVSRMFKDRNDYRKKISKSELECLKTGTRKLSVEEKIEAGKHFVVL